MGEAKTYFTGLGRRKESIARVRVCSGKGSITVNKRSFEDYFPRETHRITIVKPFEVTGTKGKFDVAATISGGGLSGQADALKLGIARALLTAEAGSRIALKKAGFLTRDARVKERKKYGQKRARKKFQFSKR